MASAELLQNVKIYNEYILKNGIDERVINAYCKAVDYAFYEGSVEYGLELSKTAKRLVNDYICEKTNGGSWELLERYSFDRGEKNEWVDLYYSVLKHEAQNKILDSYFLYLERHRDPEERFYLPRRKQFLANGFIQGLQDLVDDKLDILSVSMAPGVGKGGRASSKVLTPNGYITMADVQVGTEVISGTGNRAVVLGKYDQGERDIYRFTFDDGSTCDVSDNHLWYAQTIDDRRRGNRYRVFETSNMVKNFRLSGGKRRNYSIDYVSTIDCFDLVELAIKPYLLGVLIGDGCIVSGLSVSLPDIEVKERVAMELPDGYELVHIDKCDYRIKTNEAWGHVKSKLRVELERYGLFGCHSRDKFIPKDYLYASYEDRLNLLRGLLDADGCVSNKSIEYTTVSETLANDVRELVHSLGGYCSIRKKEKCGYRKDGVFVKCRDAYRLIIQFGANHPNPFYLSRKADAYKPKRTVWKRYIDNIEHIGKEQCWCIYISDESHLYITDDYIITHNTTLEEYFLSGVMGWFPDLCNLFSSHSGHVTRMVYDVIYNILGIGTKQGNVSEYAWREIFPNVVVESTNAKEEEINLGKFKPFKTLTCRALGASQTGVTRCDGILCCDDLCSGIEMAMSRMRLDKLWMMYSTDLKTRKKKGKGGRNSKELHIATRWSVWDVIGRIKSLYADDERARFISVPDIDPDTGKSNFDFDYGVGFDVKYFEDIQKSLDEITYKCLYKNEPVEREGILFNTDVLRRYSSFPFNNKGEQLNPDGIIAVCDTKDTGKDYNCLGVFRVYGQDYYLVDVVFRNIDPLSIDELNAQCLVRNGVQVAMFESNKEGSRTADKVQEKVREMGGSTVIDKRYTTANKETKIIVNSPWVVAHVLFPQPESADHPNGYKPNSEMGQFMAHLCSWSQLSKNPYDDAPDMVSMLAVRENPLMGGMAKVSAVQNPFRRGR